MVISNDFCRQKNDRYLPEMCFYFLRDWCIRVGTWCASLDFQRSEISHVCLRLQQGFSSKTKHGPVQWSPVFYHVLWSSVWHMEGKTLDQHTHTPCLLVKHFHNSPGSESLGATGGDSGTWSMWGNNKIWKFTSETVWNIWISIFQPMKTFHFIGFACVLCINAYCIEKNGVLDPWQLGWLAIRRWDFKPDTRRGFGIYNAVIAYIL